MGEALVWAFMQIQNIQNLQDQDLLIISKLSLMREPQTVTPPERTGEHFSLVLNDLLISNLSTMWKTHRI